MTVTAGPGVARSRLDPEPMPRRDVLGLLSLWSAAATLLFGTLGLFRLPKPAILSTPSKKFRVMLPETLAPGEPFVPPGRSVALFRDAAGVYAISTVCTHLGCVVRAGADGFQCPCHGSAFTRQGDVVKGPAPRALDWLHVSVRGGAVIVDEGVKVPPGTKVAS
jgi:nitrite reductase/ring-hydroxylating ferredoxin subunit